MVGGAHEVQHRQHGSGTGPDQLDLVAELGQHRLARVDDQEGGVDVQQGAQHLGFLFEDAMGLRAGQEAADAFGRRRAGRAGAVGRCDALDVLAQPDGVLQPRRVQETHGGAAVHHQIDALDMPRGAGTRGHRAEVDAPRQGAQ